MAPFSKPETVLKQAEGLVSVGQTHAALQSLTEMFTSKRFRSTPLPALEPIMNRFVELCVDMRKGRAAKEGLMQYKNIAQNTSVQSIESVISRFVFLADAKVKDAQEKAAVKIAVDVDDLEASETPESILLGAVSGDQSKDRTDRALVTPWLKFLWESYRTSLETLKNNARLEVIYQQIAQQAFKFCLKHQRKVEFRRLCETLRLHLTNVAKYAHQPHAINLSDPDTLQHHLDTRFAQLNTSVELELWQEAFRSVEDVHNLLTMAKKAPRPAMMANYYEKLTKIFLMSGNALYHAAAWSRYYAVLTNIGGKSDEDLGKLAGQVLLSALAVPVGLHVDDAEESKGKSARLTALLGLSKTPTRANLLKDALSRDILKLSSQPIKSLYHILEVTFDPLTLCSSIAPLLQTLASDESSYAPYHTLLHRAVLSRLLSQLSQVYSTINISSLLSLVAPLSDAPASYRTAEQIEAYVMGCARRGELSIKVDHKAGCITFVDDPFVSTTDESRSNSRSGAVASAEADIQSSTAEIVKTRLSRLGLCLHNALLVISREASSEVVAEPVEEERQQETFRALVAAAEAERKALQLRRALVARRRELLSELSVRKEKEETSRKAEISRREKEEEGRRAKEDIKRKEIERVRKVNDSIRVEEAKKLAQQLIDRGVLKGVTDQDMESLNTDKLRLIQVEQLEKEKKDLNERLRITAKRIDHLERAYRKEERPMVAKDYEQQKETDRVVFEAIQQARIDSSKVAHEQALEAKKRLWRMGTDYYARKEMLIAKRKEEFAKRKEAAQKKMEDEKAKRRKAVLQEREERSKREEEEERKRLEYEAEQAKLEAERLAEEERQRKEEEAVRAAAETKKREEEERHAALRKQREQERADAAEKARLQREREEEAEARARARAVERAQRQSSSSSSSPASISRGATNGGDPVWRRSTLPPPVATNSSSSSSIAGPPPPSLPLPLPLPPPLSTNSNGSARPTRTDSPGPAGPPKFKAGSVVSSWRQREEARAAAGGGGGAPTPPGRPSSPAVKSEPKKDDDGFTTVPEKKWRSKRLEGRS